MLAFLQGVQKPCKICPYPYLHEAHKVPSLLVLHYPYKFLGLNIELYILKKIFILKMTKNKIKIIV